MAVRPQRSRNRGLQGNPQWLLDSEVTSNSGNGCAGLSLVPWLAGFRWHDNRASVGMTVVGAHSLPGAITSHSSIKEERPCSIRAGNGRRLRLFGPSILRV